MCRTGPGAAAVPPARGAGRGGGAVRRRRGLRRGEPIGSGRGLLPPAAPRRFQSLNGQTGPIAQWERAGAGGAARLSQSSVGAALPANHNRRPAGSTHLPPGAAVHAGSCRPGGVRAGVVRHAGRRAEPPYCACARWRQGPTSAFSRKWRSAAWPGARRRRRRGPQPGGAMADVTARSLQYEYKAVSSPGALRCR